MIVLDNDLSNGLIFCTIFHCLRSTASNDGLCTSTPLPYDLVLLFIMSISWIAYSFITFLFSCTQFRLNCKQLRNIFIYLLANQTELRTASQHFYLAVRNSDWLAYSFATYLAVRNSDWLAYSFATFSLSCTLFRLNFRLNSVHVRNIFTQTELRTAKSKKKNVIFGQYQTKMVTVDMGRPG